jgi:hypothetical protein
MKYRAAIAALGLAICMPAAHAAVTDEEFAQLREQLALMSERLDNLEAENRELRALQGQVDVAVDELAANMEAADAAVAAAPVESWSDRVSMEGDFRYRYESISAEGSQTRQRNRIRARTNITAQVSDRTEVGFGLATGGDDPVSTNQTLGGGGSSKSVVLNLAYADWEFMDDAHLILGKFNNPLTRVGKQGLMWDGDWTPEGAGFKYSGDTFFASGFGTYLESDSRKSNDSFAWGGQLGMTGQIGGATLLGGLGYFSIEAAGKSTSFGDPGDPDDFFGNTAIERSGLPCGTTPGTDCVYRYDYLLTEVFAEASFEVGDMPVRVFADYVTNGDVSDNDTGWTLGTTLGQTKDRGQWQFSYYYTDKEADAVLGLLTDSDFAGGGADAKGHWLQVNWGVNKHWTIGAQYFINEVDIAGGTGSDYDRLMIDTQWKWK